jgi:hypothetical protein
MQPMLDVNFAVESAEVERFAAAPLLLFKLRVNGTEGTRIQAMGLRCQIRIEPSRRCYSPLEQQKLAELFGGADRWGQTLRPFLWAHASLNVPPFTGSTCVDLPVPCSFDFNLAATKYFSALEDGEMPLCFLFSGTVFYDGPDGSLRATQIPWDKEACYRLSAVTWQELMDRHYPNSAWLCLRRDISDRFRSYQSSSGLATPEQTMEKLLAAVEPAVEHEPEA